MTRVRAVVRKRVTKGFGFAKAQVSESSSNCITIALPHSIAWMRWLAQDVSGIGSFGLGKAVPSPKKSLLAGAFVRFPHDRITRYNSRRPVVKIIVGRPGIIRWTAKIERVKGAVYVAVKVNASAARSICKYTSHNVKAFAPIVLDRRVVSDPQIPKGICGRSLLVGFPTQKSLARPLGPREVVADIRSGLLPVRLTVSP